jgi:hypothetical protein
MNRAVERVFNKTQGMTFASTLSSTPLIRMPVPIDIAVNMSIVTKFQSDMDQILSNFVPYNNPYIVLSWKIPTDFNLANLYEIRSEVLWSGSIGLTYPTDINASEKYKIVADTSFTIKGWLFPASGDPSGIIYVINDNTYATSLLTTYEELSGTTFTYPVSTGLVNELETVTLSGSPTTPALSAITHRVYS